MRYTFLKICLLILFLQFCNKIYPQIPAVSAGLVFSSETEFNNLPTGNPGVYARVFIKLNKNLKLAPSLTAFAPKKKFFGGTDQATLKNYMFHGDFDMHYSLYKDYPLRIVGFGGINSTVLFSKWDIAETQYVSNKKGIGLGVNLGAAINMFIDNSWDAYVSGKIIAGTYNQIVINLGIVYYAEGLRRKGGW